MFEHANAGNLVERLAEIAKVAIVAKLRNTKLIQSGLRNPALCRLWLFSAQRNSLSMHTILACSVKDETAPSASNVQETLERLQSQLSGGPRLAFALGLHREGLPAFESMRRNTPSDSPSHGRKNSTG